MRGTPSRRNGIVAGLAERVAAGQPSEREPPAEDDATFSYGGGGVIRARRKKTAGTPKIWRDQQFIASDHQQHEAHGRRQVIVTV